MLVYGHDAQIAKWVSVELGGIHFDKFKAIGIVHNNALIAGVVYNNYTDYSIEMSVASISPEWATRGNLKALFAYPFMQLQVRRIQAQTHRKNKKVKRFLKRLGFQFEGYARQAHYQGGDAAVYSMLQPECRWIK